MEQDRKPELMGPAADWPDLAMAAIVAAIALSMLLLVLLLR